MQKKSILVLGSVAYDYIMKFSGDFNDNLTSKPQDKTFNLAVMPETKTINFGGTAGNISYNLGLLGTPTAVITSVGEDFVTLGYSNHFQSAPSLSFWGQKIKEDHTASCYIVNDQDSNQLIIFHEGAMKYCPQIELKSQGVSKDKIKLASVSPDNPKAMVKWAKELIQLEIPFIFDPGQMVHYFSKQDLEEIIPNAHLLIGNEFEISKIQEILGTELDGIRALNPRIIITKGDKGSMCYWGEVFQEIPIVPTPKVLDPTGAGDGYRAGLLYGLFHDFPLIKACKVGALISSKVIQTVGPQTHIFSHIDIRKEFYKYFDEEL